MHVKQMRKGECESCSMGSDKPIDLTLEFGNIWLCAGCQAKEAETIKDNAKHVVELSQKIDTNITLKADIYNAATVSFVELQAAIQANTEIPEHKKSYELMAAIAARINNLSKVIFEDEAALIQKKNERHALLVNAQNVAARLHESERNKFKQYDVNYKPAAVKKPISTKIPKAKFNKAELVTACNKYPGVPMSQVQAIVVSRGMNPEAAAKHMAELMGLI